MRLAMTYQIETRTLEPQPIVLMRRECTPDEIQETLAQALPGAFGYVIERGQQPVGPPLTRYLSHDPEAGKMVIEGACPVATPLEGEGDIEAGELPGGEVAFTWHVGPYDRLGEAHTALCEWLAENGRQAAGPPWEVYWTDPGQEPDPGKWRTEVLLPIA